MHKNVILCGVGGQGTVLASRLISAAAMARGIPVFSAETIGMAQRGGSVFSHIRLGEGIWSPMIAKGEADLIIGFEPGEAVRLLPFLKPGGAMIVSDRAVMPVTASLGETDYRASDMLAFLSARVPDLRIIDAEKAMREVRSSKVLNLILLGAAVQSGALGLDKDDLREAVRSRIPERFHELNDRALAWAAELS